MQQLLAQARAQQSQGHAPRAGSIQCGCCVFVDYRVIAVLWCAGSNSLSTSRSEPSLPPNSGGQPALTESRQFEFLSNEIRDLRSQLLQRAAVTYPSAQVGDLPSLPEGRPTLTTHDGPTLSTEVARHDEEDSSKVAAIRLGCSIITTVAAAMSDGVR